MIIAWLKSIWALLKSASVMALIKSFFVIIIIAVISASIVVTIGLFIGKIIGDILFATGTMAIGTLILAFFTYLNIHRRSAQENRDRRERRLKEIIDWATDVAKHSLVTGVFDETIPVSGLEAEAALPELLDSVAGFRIARAESVYILNIAPEISPKLEKSVKKLIREIRKQIKLLMEYKRKITPTWPAEQVVKQIAGNNERLYSLATELIEKAAKIKAGDIS